MQGLECSRHRLRLVLSPTRLEQASYPQGLSQATLFPVGIREGLTTNSISCTDSLSTKYS